MPSSKAAVADEAIAKHEMVIELYEQYTSDHIAAIRAASKIQRELSRAEHESRRIELHLKRIEEFCKKNNIPLGEK
jgi:hypothetical protein